MSVILDRLERMILRSLFRARWTRALAVEAPQRNLMESSLSFNPE